VRALKTLAAAVLAITAAPLAVGDFLGAVPESIPSVAGWQRISGDLELPAPHVSVQYEFYVNPKRPVIYEVVRYKVTRLGPGSDRVAGNEKIQWDRDGRDVRRFECVLQEAAGGCAWHEMEKGGRDYLDEVPMLIQLYTAHNRKNR
jgi:hypothetical protein